MRSCGYQSARGTGGIDSQGGCDVCLYAETIPPLDPFDTRGADSVLDTTRLVTIEGYVLHAERSGGGWVQIVFHHVCDRCDRYAVSEPTLAGFLDWLAARSARGTMVETVRRVIDTPFAPGAISVLRGAAGGLRLVADRRCPSTPVTAHCTSSPGRPLSLRGSSDLRLVTDTAALGVRLHAVAGGRPRGRGVRGTRVPGTGRPRRRRDRALWRIRLPGSVTGAATIAVAYPLGVAYYPLRLLRAGATRRS